jgi:DNA-binding response OmpR family regulator
MSTRVLIVDDDQDLLELLSFNLVEEGYEVTVARSGMEALNAARIALPDLVLLDVKLEGLDGYTVCQMLKALPSTSTIPILLVTGMRAHLDRRKGMLAGASDYITKPFRMKDLIQRVRVMLPTAWAC